jgi:hypothetical protein
LLFNLPLEYGVRKVTENQEGLEVKGTHKLPVYTDDVNMTDKNRNTIKKNRENLVRG